MGSRRRAAALLAPFFTLLAVLLLGGATAHACATCGCGDPTLTSSGLEKPYKNRVRLSLEERFGVHETGGTAADPLEQLWTLRSSLLASWSPFGRLTVMALLPVQTSWLALPGQPTAGFTGLGDAELSVRGLVWRNRAFSPSHLISLLGGLKIPTGPRLSDSAGYPWPEDDQPGSGSWDPFAGASYVWFGAPFTVYTSVSWRQTTIGRHGYQHGSSLGASAGAQLQPIGRFAFGLAVDLRYALADTTTGVDSNGNPVREDVPDTGGTSLAITPNVIVSILDQWLLRAAVQAHVWDRWNGNQAESWTVILSTVVDLN